MTLLYPMLTALKNTSFYSITTSECIDTDDATDDREDESVNPELEREFIVFESCLNQLLKFCPECKQHISESDMVKMVSGSLMTVKHTC